ncbi:hypothetical protein M422DRAFT_268394 [Sphaerobolus stellatus SS14]|uniref:Uncharacterized protein n=1 Tax=Sphaerobolus stellatus (strain SS14) TaxID=990650 RepID=A0A0C9UYD9_SPHS4|nr:hypothetical protein M422DRAFT_268394 [Sphaerobolus stellatus SS14]
MLYQILPSVKEAYLFWKANHNQNILEVTHWNNHVVMDQTKHHFESDLENIKSIQDIMQSLARQRMACHSCTLTPSSQLEPAQEISLQSASEPAGYQDQDQDLNLPLPDDGVDILTCNFQNIVQRKRHNKAPFIDISKVKQKIIRIDPGPTIQEKMGVPQHIKNFPIFNQTQLDPLSIWSLWTDYEYQIDNNFAQTFISQSPEQPEEH